MISTHPQDLQIFPVKMLPFNRITRKMRGTGKKRKADKKYNARIKTNYGLTTMRASKQILSQKNKHSHSLDERKVELRQLRVSAHHLLVNCFRLVCDNRIIFKNSMHIFS
jgi:hypothetical protein